eukprot:5873237-Amphidinium_carterae.1
MIDTIRKATDLCGIPTVDEHGRSRYGGHSLRTGGAHYPAANGVEMLKIEMLGHWRSNLVAHYAGQAPLRDLSRDLNQRKLSDHLKDVMQQVAVELSDVKSRMEQI